MHDPVEDLAVLALDLHHPGWRHDGFSLQDVGTVAVNLSEHWDIAKDLGGMFPLQQCACALHLLHTGAGPDPFYS